MSEKKKKNFSIRKLIYNDKYLIIVSVVLALIIWVSTSMNVSPETTKTITVPVQVNLNSDAQKQLGLHNYGDEKIDVKVVVAAKKYIVRDINEDDLKVSVDTSSVIRTGNYSLDISCTNLSNDFSIEDYSPKTYNAYFDVAKEKAFDIQVNYSNDNFVEDGYKLGDVVLSSTSAVVSGPSTYVSRVDKVVADVDVSKKLKESKTYELSLKAIDVDGNIIQYVDIKTGDDKTTLTIPVLKVATLPISATLIDKPDEVSQSDIKVAYSVKSLRVGMLESELENTKTLNIGEINYSKLTVGENVFVFNPSTINGITVFDSVKSVTVTVTVPSTYKTKNVAVSSNSVTVNGVKKGYKATVKSLSASSLTVVGADVSKITATNIVGVVDLSEATIKEGISSYNVKFAIKDNNSCWIYGTCTASVEITK